MFLLLCSNFLWAQRPTQGGLFSFSSDDEIHFYDLEFIRVHYSSIGSNSVLADDDDENGIPDYVERVAQTTLEAWQFFEDTGFRSPVREDVLFSQFDNLGGSDSFDVYLVDFGGNSDGHLGIDTCGDGFCSGYLVIENDFSGYGYPSIEIATRVLVSHELFHAVQNAYRVSFSPWMSEGMATWAEHLFDDTLMDYYYLCGAYLEEPTRSINSTPAGAISSFSYGTALFFDFVAIHLGVDFWIAVLDELSVEPYNNDENADEMNVVISLAESIISEENTGYIDFLDLWNTFGIWNLGTGWRAGNVIGIFENGTFESYEYADSLEEVAYEKMSEDGFLEDTHRFYPLSSSYFWFHHQGGSLPFYTSDFRNETPLYFALISVSAEHDGLFGDVQGVVDIWESQGFDEQNWELEEGDYWLVGLVGAQSEESQKTTFCIGHQCKKENYLPEDIDEVTDTNGDTKKQGGCSTLSYDVSSIGIYLLLIFGVRRRS